MTTISVATFNCHWGLTPHNRPFDVVAVCESLDTDVLVLQEVWCPRDEASFAVEAGDQLGYKVHEVALSGGVVDPRPLTMRDHDGGAGTWSLAVLTRDPSIARPPVRLGRIAGDPPERAVLAVDVDAGDGLTVAGTHLTHRPWGSPLHLARLRAALPDPRFPAVVMGDMNMWGPVVAGVLPGWRRAVRGRTWPAHRPHSQIDHILVPPCVDVLEAEVLADVGSDHRPVRAVIAF